ncbi:hypothetical protein WA1_41035 [Scytonema hofmannii PCC 7110]|uniref:Dynamin family protein n=1 Tax=Scytonema hofmannii PCC 7110 TaxID=128403 RepID=A0A139WUP7_9CYAN|nr:hypothetical protein [Scytonema hofmannii]KYC36127.1 hypothetical protein WA1_41035 [Scytonema hofmannii PCC 7110]
MNTIKTGGITNIFEKRRSLASKITSIEADFKSLEAVIQSLEENHQQLLTRINISNTVEVLPALDLTQLQQSIRNELEKLHKIKERFCRETIKIGVVGRPKQGKSRLLQSLTGLTSAEIPDGHRQHCTGVYCSIHNNLLEETYAEVWFYSEHSFLTEVIHPYYEKLSLGLKPRTIDEFVAKPLPLLPSVFSSETDQETMYLRLVRYHINVEKYRHLIGQPSPRRISKNEIPEYVAQETAYGQQSFFNYLAVKEAKIVCKFPNTDVEKFVFVDMPGIGNTGICNEDSLIKKIAQEVDAILFVRMPKSIGDSWQEVDISLSEKVRTVIADLPSHVWSFMVLNRTEAHSPYRDNSKICQDLVLDITNKSINIDEYIIANCANSQEIHKLLERSLNHMEEKNLDLGYKDILLSQQKLAIVQSKVNAELDKVGKALDLATQDARELALFEIKFQDVVRDLTNGLEKLLQELRKNRESVDLEFKKQIETALQACRSDTGIPSIQEIEHWYSLEKSYRGVYEKYLHEIRARFLQHLLLLDEGLKRSLNKVKSQVAKVLIDKGHLGSLTQERGAEFIHGVATQISDELIPGIPSQLKYGFKTLDEYQLSYRGFIQHRLRKSLDGLTPNEPVAPKLTGATSAEQVLLNLKIAHAETLSKCENALKQLLSEPNQAAYAIVEEFFDTILRRTNIESEWRIFLQNGREESRAEIPQESDRPLTSRDVLDLVQPAPVK